MYVVHFKRCSAILTLAGVVLAAVQTVLYFFCFEFIIQHKVQQKCNLTTKSSRICV